MGSEGLPIEWILSSPGKIQQYIQMLVGDWVKIGSIKIFDLIIL